MAGRVQFFSGTGHFGKIWCAKTRPAVVAAAVVLGLAAMVGCGGDAEPVEMEATADEGSGVVAPAQLAAEVSAPGPVVSSTLQVTPWMRAALESANPDAFYIQALHAEPAQLLSNVEPTAWRWTVQAREPGAQRLFVTVDRLVQVDEEDNWRTVETYRHDMQVNVTLPYRLSRMGAALRDNIIYPLVVTLLGGLVVWFVQQWRQGRSAGEP